MLKLENAVIVRFILRHAHSLWVVNVVYVAKCSNDANACTQGEFTVAEM